MLQKLFLYINFAFQYSQINCRWVASIFALKWLFNWMWISFHQIMQSLVIQVLQVCFRQFLHVAIEYAFAQSTSLQELIDTWNGSATTVKSVDDQLLEIVFVRFHNQLRHFTFFRAFSSVINAVISLYARSVMVCCIYPMGCKWKGLNVLSIVCKICMALKTVLAYCQLIMFWCASFNCTIQSAP